MPFIPLNYRYTWISLEHCPGHQTATATQYNDRNHHSRFLEHETTCIMCINNRVPQDMLAETEIKGSNFSWPEVSYYSMHLSHLNDTPFGYWHITTEE